MPKNFTAINTLSPWQQKLFQNNSLAQIKANNPKAWADYQAAINGTGIPSGGGGAAALNTPADSAPAGGSSQMWEQMFGNLTTGGAAANSQQMVAQAYGPNTFYSNPQALSKVLALGGFTGSLDEQIRQALLSQTFAGRQQWVNNTTGQPLTPELEDVRTAMDIPAMNMIIGKIQQEYEAGRDPAALFQQRQQYVPQWAGATLPQGQGSMLDQLKGVSQRGASLYDIGPLMSPEINLYDPSKPLFDANAHPTSLFNLTGLQSGEESLYRTMTAEEFMRNVMPAYNAYYNRPAGSPVPHGLESGLTFGSPYTDPTTGQTFRSPIMSTPEYQRYQAYGYPRPPDNNKPGVYGADPNAAGPLTGWAGWTSPYSPQNVDPTFLARVMALLGQEVTPFQWEEGGGPGPSSASIVPLDPNEDY